MRSVVTHPLALLVAAGTLAIGAPCVAAAQDTTRTVPPPAVSPADSARAAAERVDSLRTAASCNGQRITAVTVEPEPPRLIGKDAPRWRRALFTPLLRHRTTRPGVVEDFMRIQAGGICDSTARAESERILRAQPFIADARVRAEPDGAGGTRLAVSTVDEIPLIVGARFRSGANAFKLGSTNVRGEGVLASVETEQRRGYRQGIGARFAHFHLLNGPNILTAVANRAPLGGEYGVGLGHPFITGLQTSAWHLGVRDVERYASFVRGDEPALALRVRRRVYDAGGVYRIAGRERGLYVGSLFTREDVSPGDEGVYITPDGLQSANDSVLRARYTGFTSTHLSLVTGVRALRFIEARGFDAVVGPQDVARGVQVAAVVAPGSRAAISGDLYAGAGTAASFVGLRAQMEGRRTTGGWRDRVASGRLAWYMKPSERQTRVVSTEFSGAWQERIPFQLSLGDRAGGPRGYRGASVAGARRLVARAEQRWVVSTPKLLALGAAAFADAANLWAGDVPFGVTTGVKPSVGIGILASAPRESQRLARLDLAYPISREPGTHRVDVRLTLTLRGRSFWREPSDIAQVRAATPTSSAVNWP